MEKSELQLARAAYLPKLPKGLQGNVKVKEGAPTQSVDNQEEIKKLNRLYLHKAVKGQCSQRCLSSVATSGREGSHISLMRASMCCMNSS